MNIISTSSPIVANSITHTVGQIFQPVFRLFALILAAIYSVIPNYAVAIAILTIIIMGALTPLTVKSWWLPPDVHPVSLPDHPLRHHPWFDQHGRHQSHSADFLSH